MQMQNPILLGRTRIATPKSLCLTVESSREVSRAEADELQVKLQSCSAADSLPLPIKAIWLAVAKAVPSPSDLSDSSLHFEDLQRKEKKPKSCFLRGNSCSFLPGEHGAAVTHAFIILASRHRPTVATMCRLGENPCRSPRVRVMSAPALASPSFPDSKFKA